jgi:hypothetical protein
VAQNPDQDISTGEIIPKNQTNQESAQPQPTQNDLDIIGSTLAQRIQTSDLSRRT